MKCRKHAADLSSSVGVCASCLRERLIAIMAAQAQKQAQGEQNSRKSDALIPPPISFPRSVSPYISRRKTDTAADAWKLGRSFYSTPLVGPAGAVAVEIKEKKRGKGGRISSLFLGLFRSKSDSDPSSDPGVSVDSASPSWFSNIIPGRRKKQIRTFSIDENSIRARRAVSRNRDRGMSPARYSDVEDDEHCNGGSSGYSSESSQGWRQTPRRTPAAMRRGGRGSGHNSNVSGLAFCLSPLVRASPNRPWNLKPEMAAAGESQKPPFSTAAAFSKNRSRKLADLGRYNHSKH